MPGLRATEATPGTPVRLEGVCAVEDAEALAGLLLADPAAPVDWRACTRLHTAVYQVLLRLKPTTIDPCGDTFVQRWLATAPRNREP